MNQMKALVIGGTRNLGPSIVQALLEHGYKVAVLNRGVTPDDLSPEVERLRADRSNAQQLRAAIGQRDFDLVVDTTLYTGAEAQAAVEIFRGRAGRYIFLSTGQVYLVRLGVQRPFKEEDYAGPVMAEPPRSNESDYANWLYGYDKREAEDVFSDAWNRHSFGYTSLRLPMVNSERDHYHRIYGYMLRLNDGGPILIPNDQSLPIRHVYGEDVVQAILRVAQNPAAAGQAYNIGQDESLSLDEFLDLLARLAGKPLKTLQVPRQRLNAAGLLPECSPFSGEWMSALENARSKAELGMQYTPFREYVAKLVRHYSKLLPQPVEEYSRRKEELALAKASVS
jgi:2'-hydroxyisoflavone reductase